MLVQSITIWTGFFFSLNRTFVSTVKSITLMSSSVTFSNVVSFLFFVDVERLMHTVIKKSVGSGFAISFKEDALALLLQLGKATF